MNNTFPTHQHIHQHNNAVNATKSATSSKKRPRGRPRKIKVNNASQTKYLMHQKNNTPKAANSHPSNESSETQYAISPAHHKRFNAQEPNQNSMKTESSKTPTRRGRPPKKNINKQTQQPPFFPQSQHSMNSINSNESEESSDTECQICFDRVPSFQANENVSWLGCDECEAWFHLVCLHEKDVQRHNKNKHSFWKCPYCVAIVSK